MTRINVTPPDFSLVLGTLDITGLVTQISLRQSTTDIRNPIIWEGTIDIARTLDWPGESLDDFVNPTRWARGKHPLTFTIAGTLFATLRIGGYVYDEDLDRAQINVTQLLGLLDYKTPPQDYRFISNSSTNLSGREIASSLLTAAGISSFDLSGYAGGSMPPPNRTNRSYIGLAQEIMGERGYWLYHAPDETVRLRRIDFNATKGFERPRDQLIEWNRQPQRGIVPTLYRVVGGGEKFQSECSLASAINQTENIYGDRTYQRGYWYRGKFVPTTTVYQRAIVERIVTEVVRDEPSIIEIKQTNYQDLKLVSETEETYTFNLRKVSETYDIRYYDQQGRLVKQVRRLDTIAKNRYPDTRYDLYPYALQWITGQQEVTTEYSHDPSAIASYSGYKGIRDWDTNVLRLKIETTTQKYLNIAINKVRDKATVSYEFFVAPKEKTIETWIEKCPGNAESTFLYRRKVFSRDPFYNYTPLLPRLVRTTELLQVNDLSKDEDDVTPPSWSTRPPLFPRVNAKLFAEVKRTYPGANDDLIDKREFEYSAQSIITNNEARTLAGIFADLTIGRAFGYEVALSLRETPEFIADPTPLQVAWFHDRAMLLESVSLVFVPALNEAELSWEAVTLRSLSPAVGLGTPTAIALTRPAALIPVIGTGLLNFATQAFNAADSPDFSLISVDGSGNVVTSGGFVQASANQNQFANVLVEVGGTVVVSVEGNVLTRAEDVYDPVIWDAIATANGEVLTINGEVAWV